MYNEQKILFEGQFVGNILHLPRASQVQYKAANQILADFGSGFPLYFPYWLPIGTSARLPWCRKSVLRWIMSRATSFSKSAHMRTQRDHFRHARVFRLCGIPSWIRDLGPWI